MKKIATMTTALSPLLCVAMAMAVLAGCLGQTEPSGELRPTLRDACSGEPIGTMDLEADEYRFADGSAIQGDAIVSLPSESLPAELREALEAGGEPTALCGWQPEILPTAASGVLWATRNCWYMSEGGVGCYGCAYPAFVTETCWDYTR